MLINILRSPIKENIIRGGFVTYKIPFSLSMDFTKQLYIAKQ